MGLGQPVSTKTTGYQAIRVAAESAVGSDEARLGQQFANVTRAVLEEHAVLHQIFVAKLLGVVASPRLDPLGNESEERVTDIPRSRIEVGSADIGVFKLDVVSDRHLLDPSIDDDNLSSCLPNCGASTAGSRKVATRSARARGRDDHRLAIPVERERD